MCIKRPEEAIKLQVAEAAGYTAKERFPLHYDRMPLQMLAYSRLARIGDVARGELSGARETRRRTRDRVGQRG